MKKSVGSAVLSPQSNGDSRKHNKFRIKKKKILFGSIIILLIALVIGTSEFTVRYQAQQKMQVPVQELSNSEYPENPSTFDPNYQRYADRKLNIIKHNNHKFDFILEPTNERTAQIAIKDIDLSLFIPKVPEWVEDEGLEIISLVDREWNRQQVSFPADSEHIEVIGGDNFEQENIAEVALARNCLNAGLWEIILSTKDEDGNKSTYYQAWFDLPMGHYKNVFEDINNISYWKHWWRLEHWQGPTNTITNVDLLRNVTAEKNIATQFPLDEKIIVAGEQKRKVRTTNAVNFNTWNDFYQKENKIQFASFIPPGFYTHNKPKKSEYWRINKLDKTILRNIQPVGSSETLQEIELVFSDRETNETRKLFISGINIKDLPQLPVEDYGKGLYMPMGIGVPPFYQSYEELKQNPPAESPYFSVLLDADNKWIDHHGVIGIDGPAMHRDIDNPELLHLYLLSYERNTLIGHFLIDTSDIS